MIERRGERVHIVPRSGWHAVDVAELWRYRGLLWRFVVRDIQARYKQTVLGVLWAVIQPVTMMVVMTFVFGKGLRLEQQHIPGVPYALSFLAAQIVWSFFANGLANTANSVIANAEIVRKIYFPRLIIPISGLGVAMVDFIVAFAVFVIIDLVIGPRPSAAVLLLPLAFASIVLATFGLGLLLSALMVRYRDFRYVVPYCVQLGFFVTPVIWWEERVAATMGAWSDLLYLNPVSGPLAAFRNLLLGQPVRWEGWLISSTVSLLITALAIAYFARVESRFADVA